MNNNGDYPKKVVITIVGDTLGDIFLFSRKNYTIGVINTVSYSVSEATDLKNKTITETYSFKSADEYQEFLETSTVYNVDCKRNMEVFASEKAKEDFTNLRQKLNIEVTYEY